MRLIVRLVLGLLAMGLCIATVLPVVDTNQWWIRIFDFPRVQFAVVIVLMLAGYAGLWGIDRRHRPGGSASEGRDPWIRASGVLFPVLLAGCLGWQAFRIFPYTPLARYQMQDARAATSADRPPNRLSMFVFNIRYDNRNADALLALVRETDPDVILLVEPTNWWDENLAPLEAAYPYTIRQPQENHYGLLLYSRLELLEPEIRFLVDPEVPSIRTGLRLRSGVPVVLYGLHPKPPGLKRPQDAEREDSNQRDAELITIAKEVASLEDLPVVVAGDFNDVAWSHTTRLFQRVSGLLDPRIGRGLYNTYSTRSRLSRYPLDHLFATDDFRLVELRRLDDVGSDHFPMLVVLSHEPDAEEAQDEPDPNPGDAEDAREAIEEGGS